MKIVLVEWVDPYLVSHWVSREDCLPIMSNVTVGILVSETDKGVEINPTLNPESKLAPISFPKSSIKRIRQLCLK